MRKFRCLLLKRGRWNFERQEFVELGNMLRRINDDNYLPEETEIDEWIVGDEERLPLDSDDSFTSDEKASKDELRIKHEEAIKSFSTCIRWAVENKVELNSLTNLRMLRQRAMEAKQGCIRQTKISDFFQ